LYERRGGWSKNGWFSPLLLIYGTTTKTGKSEFNIFSNKIFDLGEFLFKYCPSSKRIYLKTIVGARTN
jgi:hypothetical protein